MDLVIECLSKMHSEIFEFCNNSHLKRRVFTSDIGMPLLDELLVSLSIGKDVLVFDDPLLRHAKQDRVGLVWIFWAKAGYAPERFFWALSVAAKTAGRRSNTGRARATNPSTGVASTMHCR